MTYRLYTHSKLNAGTRLDKSDEGISELIVKEVDGQIHGWQMYVCHASPWKMDNENKRKMAVLKIFNERNLS